MVDFESIRTLCVLDVVALSREVCSRKTCNCNSDKSSFIRIFFEFFGAGELLRTIRISANPIQIDVQFLFGAIHVQLRHVIARNVHMSCIFVNENYICTADSFSNQTNRLHVIFSSTAKTIISCFVSITKKSTAANE